MSESGDVSINNGWLNIYKDRGISSNDVLKKLKRKFSLKKLGHYGTLDPLASGVLPIAIGEATKTINFINNNLLIFITIKRNCTKLK